MSNIDIKNIFENSSLSVIKDPFEFNNIKEISTHSFIGFSGNWQHTGKVKFQNGNTLGEQKFQGSSIDDVFILIKQFVIDLNKKEEK
jgi:hypothetical protein